MPYPKEQMHRIAYTKLTQQQSDVFAGKSLKIVTDRGPTLGYTFASRNRLRVTDHVVVDQRTRLATVFEVWFSGFSDNREVQREIYFGHVAEPGKDAPKERHAATNRIEGKGFHRRQDNGVETLEFYPSAFYSNFVELTRLGGELGFCAPSDYIKVDDDVVWGVEDRETRIASNVARRCTRIRAY